MRRVQLLLENRPHRQTRGQQRLARLAHAGGVRTLLCRAEANRRLRNEDGDGCGHTPVARREEVVDGGDVTRRVLQSSKRFRRHGRRIERAVGILLGQARRTVRLLPDGAAGAAIPLEVVGAVQSACVFRQNPGAVARARRAGVSLAIDNRTRPRDREEHERVPGVAAARRRDDKIGRAIRGVKVDVCADVEADGLERLKARARRRIDRPDVRLAARHGVREPRLVEFAPLDGLRNGRTLRGQGREMAAKRRLGGGRPIVVGGLVEKFVDERLHAVPPKFPRAALPHLPVEGQALLRDERIRQKMAVTRRERGGGRRTLRIVGKAAVRPAGASVIHPDGEAVLVVAGGD